jgi:chemotaxis protein CheY-P-specific phosphatase CheC
MKIAIEAIDQCPLEKAIGILGGSDAALCVALMEMEGTLSGHMILAFDDVSGWVIPDLLLGRSPGTTNEWGDVETSCVLETMNIAGSAYLNGIARDLTERGQSKCELVPSPPVFLRDFAESLLESAFMDQALAESDVVFARARFDLSGQPRCWTFLLIPDPDSLKTLSDILSRLS